MTKVEVSYALAAPLSGEALETIARLHGVYGLQAVKVAPALDALTVLYDATRLRPAEVDRILLDAGLAVTRRAG
jgi:copper chaperone CopZ